MCRVYGAVIDGQPACLGACEVEQLMDQREQMIAAVLDVARVLRYCGAPSGPWICWTISRAKLMTAFSGVRARATHWRGTAISSGWRSQPLHVPCRVPIEAALRGDVDTQADIVAAWRAPRTQQIPAIGLLMVRLTAGRALCASSGSAARASIDWIRRARNASGSVNAPGPRPFRPRSNAPATAHSVRR